MKANDECKKQWTDTLSKCSFELMKIIVKSKTKEMKTLQKDISDIKEESVLFKDTPLFQELDIKLYHMEKRIIENKKEKVLRDRYDYESNIVYFWKKPQFQFRSRKASSPGSLGKHVSFSDTEIAILDYTMAETASNTSPKRNDRGNIHHPAGHYLNPQPSLPLKRKKKKREKETKSPQKIRRGGRRRKKLLQPNRTTTENTVNVLNLSKRELTISETTLLAKGLNFLPIRHFNLFETVLDVNKFVRKLTLRKHYFNHNEREPLDDSIESHRSESSVSMDFPDLCAVQDLQDLQGGVCQHPGSDIHFNSGDFIQDTVRLLPCEFKG